MTHPGWAVAIVEPGRDEIVDRGLRRYGFRVVFLTYRKLLTGHNRPGWQRSGDMVDRPLFPGYLFVELWPDQPWPRSERIKGYVGLIDDGRRTIPDSTIGDWQFRVNTGDFDDKRPERKAKGKSRGISMNDDPEAARTALADLLDQMLGAQDRVYA